MKKVNKILSVLLVIFLITSQLTGCGNNNNTEVHLAIVLGSHRNSPVVNIDLLGNNLMDACTTGGSVTFVCDDGQPYSTTVDIPAVNYSYSASKRRQIAGQQIQQLTDIARSMLAVADESDTLKAIQLASRSLEACCSDSGAKIDKRLILLDPCISTTGKLTMTAMTDICSVSEEAVVSLLANEGELPSLEGVSVTLVNCGDVAGEQPELSQKNREKLKSLWISVLKAGGAADVQIRNDLPLSAEYESDMPYVTPVLFVEAELDYSSVFGENGMIGLSDAEVGFDAGSAILSDKNSALHILLPVIDYMNQNQEQKLLIAGCTAGFGDNESSIVLSRARAVAICALICSEGGISGDRMVAAGLGYMNVFYIDDHNPDGSLNDDIAQLNRVVWVMPLESEKAQEVLSGIKEG